MFKRDVNRKTKDSDDNSKQSSKNEGKNDNTSNNQSNTDSTNNTKSDSSTPSGNSDHSSLTIGSGTPDSSSSSESDHSPDHPSQEGTDKNYSDPPTPESSPSYNNNNNNNNTNNNYTPEPKTIEKPSSSSSGESSDNNVKGYYSKSSDSSISSNSSNFGTISREQINNSSHINLDEQKDLDLSTHQEIVAELINDINSIEGKSDISNTVFDRPSLLAEKEAVSFQHYLEDIKDNYINIVDSRDFSNSRVSRESRDSYPTYSLEDPSIPHSSSDESQIFQSPTEDTSSETSITANSDNSDNSDVIAEKVVEEKVSVKSDSFTNFDFSDYYSHSDHSDYFESQVSSGSNLAQQVLSDQQQKQEEVVFTDVIMPPSFDNSYYETKVLEQFQDDLEDNLFEDPQAVHDAFEGHFGISADVQSDSLKEIESPTLSDTETESKSTEQLNEGLKPLSNQNALADQDIQNYQNSQNNQDNQQINLSSSNEIQTDSLSKLETNTSSLTNVTNVTNEVVSSNVDIESVTTNVSELSFEKTLGFQSEKVYCTSSSLFSSQSIIQTELLSEIFILETNLESSKQLHVEEESSVISDNSPTTVHSFDKTSLDSPRLLTQSYEQLLQDIEQVHLIDIDHEQEFPFELSGISDLSSLGSYTTLLNQTESVELTFQKPVLPDPPPYDFRADLEQQEEWEASHSPSIRNQLLRRLQQARIQQEAANYNFALERGQTLNAQLDKSSHESENTNNTENITTSKRSAQNTDSVFDDGEVSRSTDINPDIQTQSVNSQQSRTSLDSQRSQSNVHFLFIKHGLFTHIAQHVPILNTIGTKDFLDSLVQSKEHKQEVLQHLIYRDWGKFSTTLRKFADQRNIIVDPEILYEIINILRENLFISVFIDIEGITSATLTSNLTFQKSGDFGKTGILYRSTSHESDSLKQIITKTDNVDNLKNEFNEWYFSNYKLWRKLFYNQDQRKITTDTNRDQRKITTVINQRRPKRVFIDEVKLEEMKKNSPNKDFTQEDQFFQSMNRLFSKSKQLYSEIENGKVFKVEITVNNWYTKSVEKMNFKMLVNKVSLEETNERLVEEIFKHPTIIKEILGKNGNYQEGDLIFIRNQVYIDNLADIEKNYSLDSTKYGYPDEATYRRPDFICLISRKEGEKERKGIIMLEVKKTSNGFSDYGKNGSGRPQSSRDSVGVIHKVNDHYKYISLDDIEITSIIATLEISEFKLNIEAEIHYQQVLASKVLPFAGRKCTDNTQFEAILKEITDEE